MANKFPRDIALCELDLGRASLGLAIENLEDASKANHC